MRGKGYGIKFCSEGPTVTPPTAKLVGTGNVLEGGSIMKSDYVELRYFVPALTATLSTGTATQ
jgi:hypothetical protein